MVAGEDSVRRVSPCAAEGGGNVEVDTWNQVERRSHRVAYDNEDGVLASLQDPPCDEGESWMSLRSFWNPTLNSLEVVHQYEFSCYHQGASPASRWACNRNHRPIVLGREA